MHQNDLPCKLPKGKAIQKKKGSNIFFDKLPKGKENLKAINHASHVNLYYNQIPEHGIDSSKGEYIILGCATTIRRVSQNNSSMIGMLFLRFQGNSKSSTNANILNVFYTINPSWDFYLWNKIGSSLLCQI